MNDKSMGNQSAQSNNEAAEAQATSSQSEHFSGGSAMLDAQAKADETIGDKPNVEDKAATNIAGNKETEDPTDAEMFTTTGAYPPTQERLEKDYTVPPIAEERDMPDPEMTAENANNNLNLRRGQTKEPYDRD